MISTSPPRKQYTGDGSTQVFTVNFQFFAKADLLVYLTNPALGTDILQVFDSDYVVSGGAGTGSEAQTGSIAFVTAPPTGYVVTIIMSMPQTQTLDIVDNDPFPAASVESALDRCVLIMQQIAGYSSRTMRQAESDPAAIGKLPLKAARLSKFLAFDSNGDPIASSGTPANTVPVSAYIETLLDDADAATARATLLTPTAAERITNKVNDDGTNVFSNTASITKKFRFDASPVTAGQTRVFGVPDLNDVLVGLTATQTLTNKTLTSPSIGGTVAGAAIYTTPTLTTPLFNGFRVVNAIKTTTYLILVTDHIIVMDTTSAGFTVTLPTAPAAGQMVEIKKSDATFNIATIARGGSTDTIGASLATSTTLNTQGESVILVYDAVNANWIVYNRHIPSVITAYTPTFVGFGTVSAVDIYWKRIGDAQKLFGRVTAGTVTASTWSMTLASGTAKGPTGIYTVGRWQRNNGGGTAVKGGVLILSSGDTTVKHGIDDYTTATSPVAALNGSGIFGNTQDMIIDCLVPITGWNG